MHEEWHYPNTCHPELEKRAEFVRTVNRDFVQIPLIDLSSASIYASPNINYPDEDTRLKRIVMRRVQWWAPAPFVGDPQRGNAFYIWDSWVGPNNYYVAGDSELIWEGHQ